MIQLSPWSRGSYDIAIFPGLPGTQHPAVRRFMTNKVPAKRGAGKTFTMRWDVQPEGTVTILISMYFLCFFWGVGECEKAAGGWVVVEIGGLLSHILCRLRRIVNHQLSPSMREPLVGGNYTKTQISAKRNWLNLGDARSCVCETGPGKRFCSDTYKSWSFMPSQLPCQILQKKRENTRTKQLFFPKHDLNTYQKYHLSFFCKQFVSMLHSNL